MDGTLGLSAALISKLTNLVRLLDPVQRDSDAERLSRTNFEEMLQVYEKASRKLGVYQAVDASSQGHSFTKIVPRFLHLLRDCLLTGQWPKVLQLLQALVCEWQKVPTTLWKVGLASLYQDGERNVSLVDRFVRHLCVLRGLSSLEVLLDYLMFLLAHGNVSEAKDLLADWKKENLRQATLSTNEIRKTASMLFFAYQGLILYTEWKAAVLKTLEDDDEDLFGRMSEDVSSQTARCLADSAMEYLTFVKDTPGVWDIFVTKLAEIYEFYEMEECNTLLSGYRDNNPTNPNAHRYLFEFLERNGGDRAAKLESLKVLIQLDPSNSLALKLYEELASANMMEALSVLFDFLDFSHVDDNKRAWKMLEKALKQIQPNSELANTLTELWSTRKDWWPEAKLGDESRVHKRRKLALKQLLETFEDNT